jgi:heme/copper-type cytochrome/quinol oxidase subunit 2
VTTGKSATYGDQRRVAAYAGQTSSGKLVAMWWFIGIVVVLVALLAVAAVRRRRRSGEDASIPSAHTEQNKSIGNYGSHL